MLLRSELLPPHLPRIKHYARRPLFDHNFNLRGPGWHPEVGILVHGEEVEPAIHEVTDGDVPAIERLPPERRQKLLELLLGDRLAGLSAKQVRQYLDELTGGQPAKPRKPRRKK